MSDERVPSTSGATVGTLLRAVDHLRDDVREDNQRLEERVMAAVADLRAEQRSSVEAHAKAHLTDAISTESELGRIREFMRAQELTKAYRDGVLGVFRFVVEQVSRHAKPITGVLLATAAAALAVSGNIRFEVAIK